ncbi:hypothetical protein EFE23_15260 [Micromonospora solifontis]|uniref:TIGR04222 domain-containing membrane protein n=1 Tax=Micromonospora solifontis TaxID=2487138 RepID=A0ABX9WH55_9ACTN|nr:hypothetical protein EFE23_15260 [Micromonospora solifontis]
MGLAVLAVSAATLVPAISSARDWGPAPLLGAGVGVLLMLGGAGKVRERRSVPVRPGGPSAGFLGASTQSGAAGADFTFDWSGGGDCGGGGSSGGGGGGDCGGGGGGS